MSKHFEREMEQLKQELGLLCEKVEASVTNIGLAFETRDRALAKQVAESDYEIDEAEVAFEETCLKILALYQPVAKDLRMLVASLKINNDLERIADLAVNFANRFLYALDKYENEEFFAFSEMLNIVKTMLRDSIDSLVELDLAKAKKVWRQDTLVDQMHRDLYQLIYQKIHKDPQKAEFFISQLSLSRYLERIADYATNIAEDVIYLIDGSIVRHRPDQF